MSKLQPKKEFTKQHVLVLPRNRSATSSATVSLSTSDTRDHTTVEDPNTDFVHQLNRLRNPEARKLVEDFQKNVFDLLVNKVKWRVKGSNQGGSAASEMQEAMQSEGEFCKKFASTLNLNAEGENGSIPGAAGLGPPVMIEVDDGGQMEFNPYKLVAVIGQKLAYAAQLMGGIRDGQDNMNVPEDKNK